MLRTHLFVVAEEVELLVPRDLAQLHEQALAVSISAVCPRGLTQG